MMNMNQQIESLLLADMERFVVKGLFGQPDDSFSMRIPGQPVLLLIKAGSKLPETVSIDRPGNSVPGLHARLYQARGDAGAVLISSTPWSAALAGIDTTIPVLFDEQARHIGKVEAPVQQGDVKGLVEALAGGANIAIVGEQRVCLGVTPDRIVFNAELFEKCAKAFVIAYSSGKSIRRIPWWVRYIAGGRLKKDQGRATASLSEGHIPEGMNGY